jgi:ABC-type nitrate/sulfonate/bicarbonate transport system permease component
MARLLHTRAGGAVLIGALLVLWQLSAVYWTQSASWPRLTEVGAALAAGFASGELPRVFGSTLAVMAMGYACGTVVAIAVGLLMATSKWFHAALHPTVELLRPIPIPAIVPPLILVLGIDEGLKLFVVAFSVFFPVLVNTIGGVRAVDPVALDLARTLRVGRLARLRCVILPASLPYIFAGLRVGVSLALIITVTAEMIAGGAGVGYFLMTMQYAMRAADMYAAVLLLAATGYLMNRAVLAIEHRVLHWYIGPGTS